MSQLIEVSDKDDRCVFRTVDKKFFHKLYFGGTTGDFQREAFITSLLSKGLAGHVVKEDQSQVALTDAERTSILKNNPACGDKIRDAETRGTDVPYLVTQSIDGAKTFSEWLEQQDKPIDVNVIRSFAFQLVYLVGRMHTEFGIQHNDIHESNIMVRETNAEKTVTFTVGNDLFECTIPPKGLEVILFDFGSSVVKTEEAYTTANNAWRVASPVALVQNQPPEILFTSDYSLKQPEADAYCIGHVLLSMIAHGHPQYAYAEFKGVHTTNVTVAEASKLVDGKILSGIGLTKTSPLTQNVPKSEWGKLTEMLCLNVIALDAMFNGYDNAVKLPEFVAQGLTKPEKERARYEAIQQFYSRITTTASSSWMGMVKSVVGKSTKNPQTEYVSTHLGWLRTVCETGDPYRLSFMRRLMAFDPSKRRDFALKDSKFCLTSALFHPFFQLYYKGMENASVSRPFDPPLQYAKDTDTKKEALGRLVKAESLFYAKLFDQYATSHATNDIVAGINKYAQSSGDDKALKVLKARWSDSSWEKDVVSFAQYFYPNFGITKQKPALAKIVELAEHKRTAKPLSADEIQKAEEAERQAQLAAQKAEEERQRKAEEARLAKEEADRQAQAAANAKAAQDAAEKAAKAEQQRLLDEAQRLAAAKTAADKAAEQKRIAEEAERLRLAEEERKRAEKEAADKAAAEAAAKAAADKKQREAEEAARSAAAAKVAQEEAQRKAEEAQRNVPTTSALFTAAEQNVLWQMRQLAKDNSKEELQKFERQHGALEKVYTNAYTVLDAYLKTKGTMSVLTIMKDVKARLGSERTNLFDKKEYVVDSIIGYAVDVISIFYLVSQGKKTKADITAFFNPENDAFSNVQNAQVETWINKYLGAFLDEHAKAISDASAADRPSPVPVPIPQGGKEALKPVPQTVLVTLAVQKKAVKMLFGQLRASGATVTDAMKEAIRQIRATIFASKAAPMDEFENIYGLRQEEPVKLGKGGKEIKWPWLTLLASFYTLAGVYEAKIKGTQTDFSKEIALLEEWMGTYNADGSQNGGFKTEKDFSSVFNTTYQKSLQLVDAEAPEDVYIGDEDTEIILPYKMGQVNDI